MGNECQPSVTSAATTSANIGHTTATQLHPKKMSTLDKLLGNSPISNKKMRQFNEDWGHGRNDSFNG